MDEPEDTEPLSEADQLVQFTRQVEGKYGVTIDAPIPSKLADLIQRIRELQSQQSS